jgi:hypothetical protein
MEWRRIEEKWLAMTVKLQAGTQEPKLLSAADRGRVAETAMPKDDPSPVSKEPNAPIIA